MSSNPSLFIAVMQFVGIFILMASFALLLRHEGVISSDHAPIISRMITDLVLPSLIFYKISDASLDPRHIESALAMFSSELIVGLIAWIVGRFVIRLEQKSLGAFILASTFGSTNLMGTALVQILYPGNSEAMASGIMVSLGGVGIPVSSVGVMVALYFGNGGGKIDFKGVLQSFVVNPIILAFVLGLTWSYFSLPVSGIFLSVIFGALKFTGISLTFLVALLTGLTVKPITRNDLGLPLICCAILVLIVEPILAYTIDGYIGAQGSSSPLLLLLGAMPASPIAIALSLRYGCNVDIASKLVVGTCIICVVTLPSIAYIYG